MKLTPDYCCPSSSLTSKSCLYTSSIDKKIKKYRRRIRKQISKLNKEGKLSKKSSINLKKRFTAMSNSSLKEIQNGRDLRQKVARTMIRRLSFSETDSQDFIKNLRTEDFGISSENTFAFDESDSSIQVSECDENFLANQFAQSANVQIKPATSIFAKLKCPKEKWKVNDNLVKKVIKRARSWDVVVEVVDARDPKNSKLSGLERVLRTQGFRGETCLILNKSDLVPEEITRKWQKKMSKNHKVFVSKKKAKNQIEEESEKEPFFEYIKSVKENILCEKQKTKIKIGFIGIPNVGKSTLANRLFKRKVLGVGPKPGHTRAVIEKYFYQDFILVDTPGIFDDNFETMFLSKEEGRPCKEVPTPFEKTNLNSSASKRISRNVSNEIKNSLSRECQLVLLNALSLEYLPNLMEPVDFIIQFLGKDYLQNLYKIQNFESNEDFLRKIALQQNIFSVNGEIDIFLIARMIVCQWNRGKIPHFISPGNNNFNGN